EGKQIFTEADILGTASEDRGALDGPIVIALLAVIQEVNDLGKTTNSQEKTSSGVS
ncbi:phage tail assembly chaperone family protein, TAC, partial [Klebsiella pneumoniae]